MRHTRTISAAQLAGELVFVTSRSSGPGGQNVNKVNSKVTVRFDVKGSQILSEEEKETLTRKLATRLTNNGVLVLSSQDKRSQLQNREEVIMKLESMIAKALERKKKRKPTKPSKGSVRDRIQGKKLRSEKKKWRRGGITD